MSSSVSTKINLSLLSSIIDATHVPNSNSNGVKLCAIAIVVFIEYYIPGSVSSQSL